MLPYYVRWANQVRWERRITSEVASSHYRPNRVNRRPSLDYPVGPLQQRWRERQAERLGGLDVDDQLELG